MSQHPVIMHILPHSLSDTHTIYTRYNPKVNKGL
ncbi:hypothetical protein CLV65_0360 [Pseudoscardovia suis]|uniref:Uncharacterized protein n=1 Tax=Pseudoscardovia suis TaxID=987063 RepID=A0A261ERQ0_9BIFI|nr:hypothetical protein PSSU_1356 [Pseudoscardovia suis]PJJ69652.1 hypothetical protein CLV65_0360 [Pseudoscardovia suis]